MIFKSNFFHHIEKLNDLWNLTRTFNKTALIIAASNYNKEIVEILIRQEDININIQCIQSKTEKFMVIVPTVNIAEEFYSKLSDMNVKSIELYVNDNAFKEFHKAVHNEVNIIIT